MEENNICEDNRFEIIEKAKEKLLNATNIEDSKEEMKVLTNILFRMWQVGLINEEKLEINKSQKENSIEEDIKILENIIKGNEDCISAIYSQMKVKNDNDEDIQYYKKEIQAIQNVLSDYKRVLKENEKLKLYNNSITSELEQMTTEKFKNGWFHQSEFKGLILPKKVKDKIEHYQKLQDNYIEKYDETNEGLQAMISALQELINERK